ncbi:unnamed protein product, partial [Oppiella nova]
MCQSERLVSEIMHSLKQAFSNAYQSSKQRTPYICDTCPMHWFHRLCADMEGLSGDRAHAIIVNRLEGLPVRDRDECERLATPPGVVGGKQRNSLSIHEQNELLMSALKVLCERKQRRHQHPSGGTGSQDKSSLLEKRLSVHSLDTFKEKARNSLSNTFESIFKSPVAKQKRRHRSETMDTSILSRLRLRNNRMIFANSLSRNGSNESISSSPSYSQRSAPVDDLSSNTDDSPLHFRPRSNTLSEIADIAKDGADTTGDKTMCRSESLA